MWSKFNFILIKMLAKNYLSSFFLFSFFHRSWQASNTVLTKVRDRNGEKSVYAVGDNMYSYTYNTLEELEDDVRLNLQRGTKEYNKRLKALTYKYSVLPDSVRGTGKIQLIQSANGQKQFAISFVGLTSVGDKFAMKDKSNIKSIDDLATELNYIYRDERTFRYQQNMLKSELKPHTFLVTDGKDIYSIEVGRGGWGQSDLLSLKDGKPYLKKGNPTVPEQPKITKEKGKLFVQGWGSNHLYEELAPTFGGQKRAKIEMGEAKQILTKAFEKIRLGMDGGESVPKPPKIKKKKGNLFVQGWLTEEIEEDLKPTFGGESERRGIFGRRKAKRVEIEMKDAKQKLAEAFKKQSVRYGWPNPVSASFAGYNVRKGPGTPKRIEHLDEAEISRVNILPDRSEQEVVDLFYKKGWIDDQKEWQNPELKKFAQNAKQRFGAIPFMDEEVPPSTAGGSSLSLSSGSGTIETVISPAWRSRTMHSASGGTSMSGRGRHQSVPSTPSNGHEQSMAMRRRKNEKRMGMGKRKGIFGRNGGFARRFG